MLRVLFDQVTETVAPTVEPVTRTESKLHARIEITADDTLVDNLITAAREDAEKYCGRSFAKHTYRADLSDFADVIELPGRPIQAISSIKYYDTASPSVQQTLSTAIYTLYHDQVQRAYGQVWPSVDIRPDAVQITYTTGYSDLASPEDTIANVPMAVKQSIWMAIADMYENRESQFVQFSVIQENKTASRLLHHYRVYR